MRIEAPIQINAQLPQPTAGGKQPQLTVGDIISAEVVSVSPGGIVIETDSGMRLLAENVAGSPLEPGDQLEMLVGQQGDGRAALRLTSVNNQAVTMDVGPIEARLIELGIPPTQETAFLSAVLLHAGLPLSQENLAALQDALAAFPTLSAESAAFALANGLPLTEQTVPVLQEWLANPPALGNMAASIEQMASQLLENAGSTPQQSAGQPFLPALASARPALFASLSGYDGFSQMGDILSTPISQEAAGQAITQFTSTLPLPPKAQETIANTLREVYLSAGEANLPQEAVATAKQPQPQPAQPGSAPAYKPAPMPATESALPATTAPPAQATTTEIQAFLDILSKLFANLKPNAQGAQPVREAISGQSHTAHALEAAAVHSFGREALISRQTEQLANQIRLTDSLQNFSYCQLPFEINGNRNTAELYIFENKKRAGLVGSADRSTVLVALETEFMGRVETVLRAEGEWLAIEMRVADARIKRHFEASLSELAENIDSMRVREAHVSLLREPVTPQNAATALADSPEFRLGGFDIEI